MESTYYKANNMIKEDGEEVVETLVGKILGIELAKIQEIKQKEAEMEKEKIKVIGPRWEQLNIFDMKKTD